MKEIKKIVIPTSGLGERFRPFTKIIEKSLLPILKKPLIHYLVEEAILSGGKEIIIIVKNKKSLVVKYFENNQDFKKTKITFLVQKNLKVLLMPFFWLAKKFKMNHLV